jgi:hypothetical protein
LYALFEGFVADVVSDYVAHLERDYEFRALPSKVQDSYRHGVSKLLTAAHLPRYASVSLPDMVSQYGSALEGKPFRFEPEAFRIQEQNLRLGELSRIFAGLGINTLTTWVENHPQILEYFEKNSSHLNVENRLQEIVQYRNDASHGGMAVDDILGPDDLDRMATFVLVMASAIRECAQSQYLTRLIERHGAIILGSPTELFQKGAYFVMPFIGHLRVGEQVFVKGDRFCTEVVVQSLQIDGVDVSSVDFLVKTEVGIGLSRAVRRNVKIVRLLPPNEHRFQYGDLGSSTLSSAYHSLLAFPCA